MEAMALSHGARTAAVAGARPIRDLNKGPAGSGSGDYTRFGRSVVFRADDGRHGTEPWIWTP
jgi:hypothetical protein